MVSIETSIFSALLHNEEYSRKVYPYLQDEYFDGYHKILFNVYKELVDKYNDIPTLEAIAVTLQSKEISDSDFEDVLEFVEHIEKLDQTKTSVDWLVDQTEEYCKDKAIYNAIYQSIGILDGSDKKLDKNIIPELLDEALAVSFDQSIGMDYFNDAESRYAQYISEDARIPFPLNALNTLSNGGLITKSLSCFLAETNLGKSALMCYLAGELLKAGFDVLYITLEMSEELVFERIDANLLDTNINDLKTLSKNDFLSKVSKVKTKTYGRLKVKEYPTSSAHSGHFRHLMKELKQKDKFVPKIVFIDYINICASARYKNLSGVNSYSYIKSIAEELRGLAVETDSAFITATQVNRSGFGVDKIDMTNTSESIGLPATLDFFVSISSDDVLRENNRQLLNTLKSRWGNKSHVKAQLVGVDFGKMRYYDVDALNQNKMTTEEIVSKVGKNRPEHRNEINWG